MNWLPIFEVMIMTVFLKSTFLPKLSVRTPSISNKTPRNGGDVRIFVMQADGKGWLAHVDRARACSGPGSRICWRCWCSRWHW